MSNERVGCGDNSCVFRLVDPSPGGQRTNGGCRCFRDLESWIESENRWNRTEVRQVENSVRVLTRTLREARAEVERLTGALAVEKEWTAALGNDTRQQQAQLDGIASALGLSKRTGTGRNDATDLQGMIVALRERSVPEGWKAVQLYHPFDAPFPSASVTQGHDGYNWQVRFWTPKTGDRYVRGTAPTLRAACEAADKAAKEQP